MLDRRSIFERIVAPTVIFVFFAAAFIHGCMKKHAPSGAVEMEHDTTRDVLMLEWTRKFACLYTWILCGEDFEVDSAEEAERRFEEAIPIALENEIRMVWGPGYTRSSFMAYLKDFERRRWMDNYFENEFFGVHIENGR